ncbi:MAG: hypothetical protein KKF50_03295 [Nanoarchaeota archaeon]|nr:hypothetical protein [Nanoarchaeota archaeon]
MGRDIGVLVDKLNNLNSSLNDEPWDFNLKGYYLRCDWRNRDALYIPGCLVVVEAFNDDEDYFSCDKPDTLMEEKKFDEGGMIYIEGVDYRVVRELMFPERVKNFFKSLPHQEISLV